MRTIYKKYVIEYKDRYHIVNGHKFTSIRLAMDYVDRLPAKKG
jgi:hypothetical protein